MSEAKRHRQETIKSTVVKNPNITRRELAQRFSESQRTIDRDLAELGIELGRDRRLPSTVEIRCELVRQLREQRLTFAQIALVMNLSERTIKNYAARGKGASDNDD